jgi:hypothetical protein
MTSDKSAEDVLFAFSVEPRHDRQTLERYLESYPEFADDLLDLSHELRISASLGPADILAEDEASFQAAWQQYAAVAPQGVPSASVENLFNRFKGKAFVALAEALLIPRSVLVALRDRLVVPSSIPQGFIRRFAQSAAATIEGVEQYLALPPATSAALNFKADQKPAAQPQITFEALLAQSTLTEEQIAALQKDLEKDFD